MKGSKVYIIILNYNSWKDTVECLESILRLDYPVFRVVLVDNASTDDSIVRLEGWMKGQEIPELERNPELERFSSPPLNKPIPFVHANGMGVPDEQSVVFIKSDRNLGYAGGNNLGINYGMEQGDADFFWVLNNDTVVPPSSLKEILIYWNKLEKERRHPGIIGSKLRFYDSPEMLQGVGAVFNKYTAKIAQIGTFEADKGQYDAGITPVDFVIGASLFTSARMIRKVGVMAEEYFLYNEEIDWCLRARRAGYFVGYAPKSLIFHKQGASTKNSVKSKKKNIKAMFYQFRNIILFYKKFYPHLAFIPVSVVILRILKFGFLSDRKFFSLLYPVLTLQKEFSKQVAEGGSKDYQRKPEPEVLAGREN